MSPAILEVKNLQKVYSPKKNPVAALKGISFEVQKGEIFGILGVNGAGKSTTLNILIGLLSRTSGEVRIFGQNFFARETEIKARMNIATAYADLANNLSVYENLKVFAVMYNVPNPRIKIEKLLERLDILDLRDERFDELSAGQRTRVNFCKSFLNDPEILFLDKPTASLDPSIATHVRETLVHAQRQRGMTILMTSHNMLEVEQICNRVALLNNGEIYKIDSPRNLKAFLQVPSMEQVFMKLARGEFEE